MRMMRCFSAVWLFAAVIALCEMVHWPAAGRADAPTGLTQTTVTENSATLSWTPPASSSGVTYRIYEETALPALAPIIAATRANFGNGYTYRSDGVITQQTSRMRAIITENCTELRLVFGNYIGEGGTQTDPITVSASWDDGTTVHAITFGGASSTTIAAGGQAASDPVGGTWTKGTVVWWRSCVTVGAGKIFPLTGINSFSYTGEGVLAGDATASPVSAWASASPGNGPGTSFLFLPFFAMGRPATATPSIALVGDSIQRSSQAVGEYGLVRRALGTEWGKNYPSLNLAQAGETATTFAVPGNGARRNAFSQSYCTDAVCSYGVNDLYQSHSFAQLQADLLAIWTRLDRAGLRVWQTTITPVTGPFDRGPAEEAVRTQINDWIRTSPAPLRGYFETADQVETARNSGVWKSGLTDDGLHPSTAGLTAAGAAIDPAVIASQIAATRYSCTLVASTSQPSATITGLTLGSTHRYSVTAVVSGAESPRSQPLTVTTLSPQPPVNVRFTALTSTRITLAWDPAAGSAPIVSYDVQEYVVGTNGTGSFVTVLTGITGSTATITGLTAGTSHAWVVRAYDAAGNVSAATLPQLTIANPQPVSAIRVGDVQMGLNGEFQITIQGAANQTAILEATDNLANPTAWQKIAEFLPVTDAFVVTDPNIPRPASRYYRVSQP